MKNILLTASLILSGTAFAQADVEVAGHVWPLSRHAVVVANLLTGPEVKSCLAPTLGEDGMASFKSFVVALSSNVPGEVTYKLFGSTLSGGIIGGAWTLSINVAGGELSRVSCDVTKNEN